MSIYCYLLTFWFVGKYPKEVFELVSFRNGHSDAWFVKCFFQNGDYNLMSK